MTDHFYVLTVTLLIGFSFYGWGSILRNVAIPAMPRGFNIIAGLAVLNVIGGLIVWLGLCSRVVIYVLWGIGLILALLDMRRVQASVGSERTRFGESSRSWLNWIPWLLLLGIGLVQFEAFHQSVFFNFHDDFEKYLKYPVQILESGHLRTGLFDAMGSEALGAQSFFQAWMITYVPMGGVMLFDSVICMLASMIALISLVVNHKGGWLIAVVACLAMMAIDPLLVNTSAVYSGVAGFSLLFWLISSDINHESSGSFSILTVMALANALMVSLKTTLALMVPLFFLVWLSVSLMKQGRKVTLVKGIWVSLLSLCFACPWFLVHLSKYKRMLFDVGIVDGDFTSITGDFIPPVGSGLLSFEPYFYGFHVSIGLYSSIIILIFILSAFLLYRKQSEVLGFVTCLLGVVVVYLVFMTVFSPASLGPIHTLRYVMSPFIAVIIPLSLLAVGNREGVTQNDDGVGIRKTASIGCLLTVLFIFSPSVIARTHHAVMRRSMYAFGVNWESKYYDFIQKMLDERGEIYFSRLQQLIPEKARTLVWCVGGFHFDYHRNPLLGVDPAGLASLWLDFPFGSDIDDGIRYLKEQSIECIVWQYDGIGVRGVASDLLPSIQYGYPREAKIAWRTKAFVEFLAGLASSDQIERLYNADGFIVMRLK